MSINFASLLTAFVMFIIPMLFAITFHEAAHGYIAKIRGDNTAYLMGRVSLNPLKTHRSIIGTIILPNWCLLGVHCHLKMLQVASEYPCSRQAGNNVYPNFKYFTGNIYPSHSVCFIMSHKVASFFLTNGRPGYFSWPITDLK